MFGVLRFEFVFLVASAFVFVFTFAFVCLCLCSCSCLGLGLGLGLGLCVWFRTQTRFCIHDGVITKGCLLSPRFKRSVACV